MPIDTSQLIEDYEELKAIAQKMAEVVNAMANFDGRNNNKHLKEMAREMLTEYNKYKGDINEI